MKCYFFLWIFIACALVGHAQNVSINEAGAPADPSAMLDVASDTRGVLIPRMTALQRTAIASPAVGLLVYDLDSQTFWFRAASGWTELTDNLHGLRDADHDTKVQVEEAPDEDRIRFDIGGKEVMVMTSNAAGATRFETGTDQGVIIGTNAGPNSMPAYNTILGYGAGQLNQTGERNVFVGYQAGQLNALSSHNTFVGYEAGKANSANSNTYIGYQSGAGNTVGDHNTFLGHLSGYANTLGQRNSFLGSYSGYKNTDGRENTSVGGSAGFNTTTGNRNTFIGVQAGRANVTGADNIAVGHSAGGSAAPGRDMGSGNIFLGYEADVNINGGSYNFIAGHLAGHEGTTGNHNIYIGKEAGYQGTDGVGNIGIGASALRFVYGGEYNIAIGDSALISSINGESVAVGSKAGIHAIGALNTFVGTQAANGISEGARNVVVGAEAGDVHDAQNTTLIGYRARIENPIGYITGATAIGENAVVKKSNTIILGQPGIQVGIGTSLPTYKLHVDGGLGENLMNLSSKGAIKMTVSSQGRVHVTDSVTIDGRMRIGNINAGSRRLAVAGDVYIDDALEVANEVVIGTNTAATGHILTVDGKIACEEVRVQDSGDWPDYVFESAYDLKPLHEVHQYIQREKHLPGIPSAAEIASEGVNVGDMQKRLLEKIEELTLHMIALEQELNALKSSK